MNIDEKIVQIVKQANTYKSIAEFKVFLDGVGYGLSMAEELQQEQEIVNKKREVQDP